MNRKEWLRWMDLTLRPVFKSLSEETLHKDLPSDFHEDRAKFRMLEAFGRSFCGIASWIELEEIEDIEEKELQADYRKMIVKGISNAVNPDSPDFMNFEDQGQPLVDAAFLAQGILRAPKFIEEMLTQKTKNQLMDCFRKTRKTIPPNMNWNLFSAMVEGAMYSLNGEYDVLRVIFSLRLLDDWYLGDGIYGDGPQYHWDYYNSFVIHPMSIDLVNLFSNTHPEIKDYQNKMMPRFRRYAQIQERLIGIDGSYPVVGRSIIYRGGAFHALAQASLLKQLPENMAPTQVREALSAVITKTLTVPNTFDKEGWLVPGVSGFQPNLAEDYINIGSLYLCSTIFLPLGLSENDEFWKGESKPWSSKAVWSGFTIPIDYSI